MAVKKQTLPQVPVIPSSWADPDKSTLKVENDCFDIYKGQSVAVVAADVEDCVVVGLTPTQAREMASALIVYAFFVDRENVSLGEDKNV